MKWLLIISGLCFTSCNPEQSSIESELDKQLKKQEALNAAALTQLKFKNFDQSEKYLAQSDSVSLIIDSLLSLREK
jgi:hypothetical protein